MQQHSRTTPSWQQANSTSCLDITGWTPTTPSVLYTGLWSHKEVYHPLSYPGCVGRHAWHCLRQVNCFHIIITRESLAGELLLWLPPMPRYRAKFIHTPKPISTPHVPPIYTLSTMASGTNTPCWEAPNSPLHPQTRPMSGRHSTQEHPT